MFRTIDDFVNNWTYTAASTFNLFSCLSNESLKQAMPGGRSLGRIANHIIESLSEFPNKLGLPVEEDKAAYATVPELISAYQQAAERLKQVVMENWTDETLMLERNMYGQIWKNGLSLSILIVHEAHHRGQMTVLMRFAGLKVPGVYGPSREDWIALKMQPIE